MPEPKSPPRDEEGVMHEQSSRAKLLAVRRAANDMRPLLLDAFQSTLNYPLNENK